MRCCKHKKKRKWIHPLIPGVLLAIIPKCPLCVMAYGSAFGLWEVQKNALKVERMCSEGLASIDTSITLFSWATILSVFLFGMLIFSLVKNYHGFKTRVAICSVVIGATLMIISQLTHTSGLLPLGSALCFGGALLNTYFVEALKKIRSAEITSIPI